MMSSAGSGKFQMTSTSRFGRSRTLTATRAQLFYLSGDRNPPWDWIGSWKFAVGDVEKWE